MFSYQLTFHKNIETYFREKKEKLNNMIQCDFYKYLDQKLQGLEFKSETIDVLKLLHNFDININSVNMSIINKNHESIKTIYTIMGRKHYELKELTVSKELYCAVITHENYLYFVTQVYSALKYLNKPTGCVVSGVEDNSILLDLIVFYIDQNYKDQALQVLCSSDSEEMLEYKKMKKSHHKNCMLHLISFIESFSLSCQCEYGLNEKGMSFIDDLSKRFESHLDLNQCIHHYQLRKKILSNHCDN
ncbi:hypothetical protein AB837_00499 [bacterium AB1]|nr:hypothetical protein AB837_00499 [bacterium AB1]